MAARETLLTEAGYNKLTEELEHLITVRRREVAERISIARDFGDISENAEYDEAKNEQARVETRIIQIEDRLRHATIVHDINSKRVGIGTVVTVIDTKSGDEEKYMIVGSAEADPLENRVSNESPVGKALFGRKRGDVVEVAVPTGVLTFEIKRIAVAK